MERCDAPDSSSLVRWPTDHRRPPPGRGADLINDRPLHQGPISSVACGHAHSGRLGFFSFLCSLAARTAEAAIIDSLTSTVDGKEITLITVEGEFDAGDDKAFANKAIGVRDGIVLFNSPGGDVAVGIEIGKAIRIKGLATAVPEGFACASACALAWLGGRVKFMGTGRSVGFHAAWNADDPNMRPDAVGNAIVGAYLNSLGLPTAAVAYVVGAPPTDIAWLTFADAERIGIDVRVFPSESAATTVQRGQEWIQIFSRQELSEAVDLATQYDRTFGNASVYRYDNGWYVVVLGPYEAGTAPDLRDRLVSRGQIPNDSLITTGSRFAGEVWGGTRGNPTSPVSQSQRADQAKEVVSRFFTTWSGPASEALAFLESVYPEKIRYFGRLRSKREILDEKRTFIERWPERSYQIRPNTITVACRSDGLCTVEGIFDWQAQSPSRRATSEGYASFRFEVATNGQTVIVSERSDVLSRTITQHHK